LISSGHLLISSDHLLISSGHLLVSISPQFLQCFRFDFSKSSVWYALPFILFN
jgi:hypothetical protein